MPRGRSGAAWQNAPRLLRERVIEVGDEVVDVLDADGETDEGVADAERLALLKAKPGKPR
jgi:hypothetical protein